MSIKYLAFSRWKAADMIREYGTGRDIVRIF